MNKRHIKLLSLFMLVAIFANIICSCSLNGDSNNLIYELNSTGTEYYVIGYTGNNRSVVIPSHYNDIPVTIIAPNAFKDCRNLEIVTIPYTIETIDNAFEGCENLSTFKYKGKMEDWKRIGKHPTWSVPIGECTVHCTDGDIKEDGKPFLYFEF